MAKNVDRAVRIVVAAARLIEIETSHAAGRGREGAAAAKRELKEAYEDYMSHHAKRI